MRRRLALLGVLVLSPGPFGGALWGQDPLAAAGERIRRAVLAHDASGIVAGSPGVTLRLPGANPSAAVAPSQAAEVLRRHFQDAVERSAELVAVREVEAGQGFVDLVRRYVVRGTSEVRSERMYVGLRAVGGGRWVVVEVRSGG